MQIDPFWGLMYTRFLVIIIRKTAEETSVHVPPPLIHCHWRRYGLSVPLRLRFLRPLLSLAGAQPEQLNRQQRAIQIYVKLNLRRRGRSFCNNKA